MQFRHTLMIRLWTPRSESSTHSAQPYNLERSGSGTLAKVVPLAVTDISLMPNRRRSITAVYFLPDWRRRRASSRYPATPIIIAIIVVIIIVGIVSTVGRIRIVVVWIIRVW